MVLPVHQAKNSVKIPMIRFALFLPVSRPDYGP
jgi:hypothetical protein